MPPRERRYVSIAVAAVLAVCFLVSVPAAADRPERFNYPIKIMNVETAYLLGPGGNTQIGLAQSGLGVKGRMQFTTDVLLDLATFLNGQVKVGIVPEEGRIPAFAVGVAYFNLIAAGYLTDAAVRAAFTEEETKTVSDLQVLYSFLSLSKTLHERVRLHASYQFHFLEGMVDSEEPYVFYEAGDTTTVYMTVNQTTIHTSLMSALDFDLLDSLKFLFELGYDISYDRPRTGLGARFGMGNFNFQIGVMWPGVYLDEDIDIPVVPNFNLYFRF